MADLNVWSPGGCESGAQGLDSHEPVGAHGLAQPRV